MIYELFEEWAQCRESLLKACNLTHGTHTEDDIIYGLLNGQFKLFRHRSSGVVTEFTQFPTLKALNVFLAGGSVDDLVPIREMVYKHALVNGCSRITAVFARKGWERLLGDDSVGEVKTMGTCAYRDL